MKERMFLFPEQSSASAAGSIQAADSPGPIAAPIGLWARLTARVRAWFEVPYGYEDESGFHYGTQPPPTPRGATEATSFRARVLTDRADHVMKHSVVLPVTSQPAPSITPVAPEKKSEAVHH